MIEEKKLNTENQGSWGNFLKFLSLCFFFILHAFYELEQGIVLSILANGAVHDKTSANFVCRHSDLKRCGPSRRLTLNFSKAPQCLWSLYKEVNVICTSE